jgi:protein involved in polysaccharide export with SLBB domain
LGSTSQQNRENRAKQQTNQSPDETSDGQTSEGPEPQTTRQQVGPDYGFPQRERAIVDPERRINLPGGGTLPVAGMTIESAERAAQDILVRRFNDARVNLSLARVRTIRVYIVSDVVRPGA